MSRQLEQSQIEKILKNIVNNKRHANAANKEQLDALINEKQSLASKLERKKADYERLKHRLDTLQKIRYAIARALCYFSSSPQLNLSLHIYLFIHKVLHSLKKWKVAKKN